jgi:hypothetical protein
LASLGQPEGGKCPPADAHADTEGLGLKKIQTQIKIVIKVDDAEVDE